VILSLQLVKVIGLLRLVRLSSKVGIEQTNAILTVRLCGALNEPGPVRKSSSELSTSWAELSFLQLEPLRASLDEARAD